MKRLIYVIPLMLMLGACATSGNLNLTDRKGSNVIQPDEDGDEYELLIFDNNFDRWFTTNGRPVSFYSPSYYSQKNRIYVQAWNEKVDQQGFYRSANYPFEQRINYDYSIDYGVELNYQLFWYFKYIESTFGRRYDFPA
jgi:hypothetical protein